MNKPSILIAAQNAEEYPGLLQGRLDDDYEITIATSIDETLQLYNGQSVLMARPDYAAALLNQEPAVDWIQSTWAGVTPLINHPFKSYKLTGIKDVFGQQMAEYVVGYVLFHELRIDERAQQQSNKEWLARGSGRIQGKTMGILGTGSIGIELAATAANLGIRVIGYNSSGNPCSPFEKMYSPESLLEFMAKSDYVIGILPDLPSTTNLISTDALAAMKESALLINVGRGNLIDDAALCDALNGKKIAAAVLDVFKEEPLPQDSPLWTAKNLRITPHVAAMSYPIDIVEVFLKNLKRYMNEEELLYQIDFSKGY